MQICYKWLRRVGSVRSASNVFHLPLRTFSTRRSLSTQQSQSQTSRTGSSLNDHTRPDGAPPISDAFLPSSAERTNPDAWIRTLNTVIPSGLRSRSTAGIVTSDDAGKTTETSPQEVAAVLWLARRSYGHDLLCHLGQTGQWKGAVWLVTYLVDNLWHGNPQGGRPSIAGPWEEFGNLMEATEDPIAVASTRQDPPNGRSHNSQMTESVESLYSPAWRGPIRLGHEMLGQIWQSLGNMIVADAARSSTITPQILEIIALLHHRGIMPASIYSYAPLSDDTALRQPPTLHLLSSHILTCLSDAAWRAHEGAVVEEAHATGGFYKSIRPEVPGSMYKVRIGGLTHSIWLELVLWSCLQGGWTLHGAAILKAMGLNSEDNIWSAVSWREIAPVTVHAGQEKAIDWSRVEFLFRTGSGNDDTQATSERRERIARTVSSEVITAYIDALINMIRVGVGERGLGPGMVVNVIRTLKSFLEKTNLDLGATSWDAVILRIFEAQGIDIEKGPALAESVLALSSPHSREMATKNALISDMQWRPVPPYLIDGTAATLGVAHRCLLAYIDGGNIAGALRSFQRLQSMTDRNKEASIKAFFTEQQEPLAQEDIASVNFQSRYSGIEYPGLYPQIPVSILAPFLDLVTEARAFTFGSWLMGSEDPDGPIIAPRLYNNPVIIPALIRYASAAKDRTLLEGIITAVSFSNDHRTNTLSQSTLLALLENQLENHDWSAVEVTLTALSRTSDLKSATLSMAAALLVRDLLRLNGQYKKAKDSAEYREDVAQAAQLFGRVARGGLGFTPELHRLSLDNVLAVMACVNEDLSNFCGQLRPNIKSVKFILPKEAFNLILEGVVDAYGSSAGMELLCKLWKPAEDAREDRQTRIDEQQLENLGGVPRMPTQRPGEFAELPPDRVSMRIPLGRSDGISVQRFMTVRGRFHPSISTVRIILRQMLKEQPRPTDRATSDMSDVSPESAYPDSPPGPDQAVHKQTVLWAKRVMRLLGMRENDMLEELRNNFSWENARLKVEAAEDAEVVRGS